MCEKEKPKLVKCPECSVELPEGVLGAQIEHMETNHPEVIVRRLQKIGLHKMAERFLRNRE